MTSPMKLMLFLGLSTMCVFAAPPLNSRPIIGKTGALRR